MTKLSEPESKNPYFRAASLEELLAWDDMDFVCCAYVTVLGRQPDPPGRTYYLKQIRSGYSKPDLLWRLRRSPEGRAHDPGIAGFDRALKRAAWERRPLVGAVARLLRASADSDSRRDRALRAVMNAMALNQRYLRSISERVTGAPASFGPPPSLNALPPSGPACESEGIDWTASQAAWIVPPATPELDHLRKRDTNARVRRCSAP